MRGWVENGITDRIIGAAIEVHRFHGPGLVEQVYDESLCHELSLRDTKFERQKPVPLRYKGATLGVPLRLDLIVEARVIVDLKAKEEIADLDKAKLLSYLRPADLKSGLILNFHVRFMKDGVFRIINGTLTPPRPGSFSMESDVR